MVNDLFKAEREEMGNVSGPAAAAAAADVGECFR